MILSLSSPTIPSFNDQFYLSDKSVLTFTTGSTGVSITGGSVTVNYSGTDAAELEVVVGIFVDGNSVTLSDIYKILVHKFTDGAIREFGLITEPFSDSIPDTSSLTITPLVFGNGDSLANIVLNGGTYGIYIKREAVSGASKSRQDFIRFRAAE